jgi:hypothetical protein
VVSLALCADAVYAALAIALEEARRATVLRAASSRAALIQALSSAVARIKEGDS